MPMNWLNTLIHLGVDPKTAAFWTPAFMTHCHPDKFSRASSVTSECMTLSFFVTSLSVCRYAARYQSSTQPEFFDTLWYRKDRAQRTQRAKRGIQNHQTHKAEALFYFLRSVLAHLPIGNSQERSVRLGRFDLLNFFLQGTYPCQREKIQTNVTTGRKHESHGRPSLQSLCTFHRSNDALCAAMSCTQSSHQTYFCDRGFSFLQSVLQCIQDLIQVSVTFPKVGNRMTVLSRFASLSLSPVLSFRNHIDTTTFSAQWIFPKPLGVRIEDLSYQ